MGVSIKGNRRIYLPDRDTRPLALFCLPFTNEIASQMADLATRKIKIVSNG